MVVAAVLFVPGAYATLDVVRRVAGPPNKGLIGKMGLVETKPWLEYG